MSKAFGSWKRRTEHCVQKTRKEHKCKNCSHTIPKGSMAFYSNGFDGKRSYRHGSPKEECRPRCNMVLDRCKNCDHNNNCDGYCD